MCNCCRRRRKSADKLHPNVHCVHMCGGIEQHIMRRGNSITRLVTCSLRLVGVSFLLARARSQLELVFVVTSCEFSCPPRWLSLSFGTPANARRKEVAAGGGKNESETVSLRSICVHNAEHCNGVSVGVRHSQKESLESNTSLCVSTDRADGLQNIIFN